MKRVLLVLGILGGLAVLTSALVLLVSFRPSPPDNSAADEHAHKGIAFMQQHLYHAAIEEFETATRKAPRALDAWLGLAAVYIRLGDVSKALEGATKAVNIANDSVDVQLVLGRAHWLARNFADAEQAALKVEKLDPENPHAAELLLHIYFDRKDESKFREVLDRTDDPNAAMQDLAVRFAVRSGEFQRAYELRNSFDRQDLEVQVFRSQLALKREPERIELYPALIRNLVRLGRFEQAIETANRYRGPVPVDLEMGKAYWLAGNREAAIQSFLRASAGNTHRLSAEVALAALTKNHQHWIEAFRAEWIEKDYFVLAQLQDVLQSASSLDKALIYRYAGLFDSELFNDAVREARATLDAHPDDFEALMTLGTAYSRLGRLDDAIRYIRQGAELHPERGEVWARLGQYAMQKGDAEAEVQLQRAMRQEPSNASYLYNYAWLLDQSDRDAEAASYYLRAIEASSLSFEAMNNLALIEFSAGHSDRALNLLNRAVTSNPDNEMAYVNRGNYYAMLRSWQNALADYARAREINPSNGTPWLESSRVHMELNRADIAIDEVNAALDADPAVPDGYVLLSSAYKKQGLETEAKAALDESKRLKGPR